MTAIVFEELSEELHKATTTRNHPFKFITMATVGISDTARLRTVVLREISKDLKLSIYTDGRTQKVKQLLENDKVSLLLYHPKKLIQLKIEGVATIVTNEQRLKKQWSSVQPHNRKDYTTKTAPGTKISTPDQMEYLKKENHFTIIDIIPNKIEYLKLQQTHHTKVLFTNENGVWNGSFITP